jgi:hypothetical protein
MMMMMFITGRKLAKYMGEFKPPGLGQGCQAITVTGPLWQAHPPTLDPECAALPSVFLHHWIWIYSSNIY